MASTRPMGRGYQITVSLGYDQNGKQRRESMQWIPDPGMTSRQIEKELQRQAVLFEERVKTADLRHTNIKVSEFAKIYLEDHVEPNLKERTSFSYKQTLEEKIIPVIGHIKIRDLRPKHISKFYKNLEGTSLCAEELAYSKEDFGKLLSERGLSMAELHRRSDVSVATIRKIKQKKPIAKNKSITIAATLEIPASKLFLFVKDTATLSPGSVRVVHRVLSSMLSRAVRWGYIDTNPAANADLPRRDHKEAAFLDEEQAKDLLELLREVPVRWRVPIIVDLMTGLRRAELAGLRWCDVDMDHNLIYIRQTWNYTPRKGCYVDTPKTRDSNRPLKVSNSVIFLLKEYKAWQEEQMEIMGDAWEDQDGRVFTTESGDPVHPDTYSKWFTDFIKAHPELPKVTLHSLRHTYASLMIFDGVPLVTVSHQLGHAQSSTTANIYSHVIASAEALAAQTFDRFDDEILGSKREINAKDQVS